MKIIKPGVLPEPTVLRGKCCHCKAEFEFSSEEATREVGRCEVTYSILCPTPGCVRIIKVDE